MREKYESLALTQLKELAKVRGLKGISAMKKAELVEAMLMEDARVGRQDEPAASEAAAVQAEEQESTSGTTHPAAVSRENSPNALKNESEYRAEPAERTRMAQRSPERQAPADQNRTVQRSPERQAPADQNRTVQRSPERQAPAEQNRTVQRSPERQPSADPNRTVQRSPERQPSADQNRTVQRSPERQAPADQNRTVQRSPERQAPAGQERTVQRSPERALAEQDRTAPRSPERQASAQTADGGMQMRQGRTSDVYDDKTYPKELDSGEEASGILEVMPDGYGFIRCENYLPGENDVYVAPSQIRRFGLKTGDILRGNKRVKTQQEKFSALLYIHTINGYTVEEASRRKAFEDMTPIFPNERIRLETPGCSVAMRVMDLVSPVGKGQRGMIVSPPKAGKTTLLKEVAKSILRTNPQMRMLILLIDERPEEVTDIKEAIVGDHVEVIYSTFDELPDHHKRVSEMAIERAKRLVEHKQDVVILLDSITRLARAYNLVVPPSGRTLSGGLDPAALHMPKRFFGAARNMREGGSLTILATALVDTGSKMDDVVYEEFKGTGNMEMILDRRMSERRIFPAIDLAKSGTRREDLLLTQDEHEAINVMRKALNGLKADEATDRILDMFARTRNNSDFVQLVKKNKFI